MGIVVSATALSRDVGYYLRRAQGQVLAVTFQGVVAAYLVSPEMYAQLGAAPVRREMPPDDDGHAAAVARMDALWAMRSRLKK